MKWLLLAIAFGVVLFSTVMIYGAHSESFKFVDASMRQSPEIEKSVGHVEKVTLDPVGGYSERFTNAQKTAHMSVVITGTKGRVVADVSVKKEDGIWEVRQISVEGAPLYLAEDTEPE